MEKPRRLPFFFVQEETIASQKILNMSILKEEHRAAARAVAFCSTR